MKSARDNFWNFARDKTKSAREKQLVLYPIFFYQLKLPFLLPGKSSLVIHSFKTRNFIFSARKQGGKRQLLFWSPGKVLMPFIQSLMGFQLFYKKLVGIFFSKLCEFFYIMPGKVPISFINLISESFFPSLKKQLFSCSINFFQKYILNLHRPGKNYVIFASTIHVM